MNTIKQRDVIVQHEINHCRSFEKQKKMKFKKKNQKKLRKIKKN